MDKQNVPVHYPEMLIALVPGVSMETIYKIIHIPIAGRVKMSLCVPG
jgi:hypothetical protein